MTFEKLAALGAQGAAAGLMAAWLGFVWVTRPVSSGGMDAGSHAALALSSFVLCAWLAVAHAWMGARLMRGPDSIRG